MIVDIMNNLTLDHVEPGSVKNAVLELRAPVQPTTLQFHNDNVIHVDLEISYNPDARQA